MSRHTQQPPSWRTPVVDVDAEGRLVPESEAERQARSAALRTALQDIAAIGPDESDAPEIWDEVFQGIDSTRPHRPLFGGNE